VYNITDPNGDCLSGTLTSQGRLPAGFFKIRLAQEIFRLIFGLAEFLRKLQNSAENTPEQYKFG